MYLLKEFTCKNFTKICVHMCIKQVHTCTCVSVSIVRNEDNYSFHVRIFCILGVGDIPSVTDDTQAGTSGNVEQH